MRHYRCPLCLKDFDKPGDCPECDAPLALAAQKVERQRPHLDALREEVAPRPPPSLRVMPRWFIGGGIAVLLIAAILFVSGRRASTPPPKSSRSPCVDCLGSGHRIEQHHRAADCPLCEGPAGVACRVCRGTGLVRRSTECYSCFGTGRRCPRFSRDPCPSCRGAGLR